MFADLKRYEPTTHFNGQSTVTIHGDHATGESSDLDVEDLDVFGRPDLSIARLNRR